MIALHFLLERVYRKGNEEQRVPGNEHIEEPWTITLGATPSIDWKAHYSYQRNADVQECHQMHLEPVELRNKVSEVRDEQRMCWTYLAMFLEMMKCERDGPYC